MNEQIKIKELNNTEENALLVSSLMKKDVSGKCFSNNDLEGCGVSYLEIAKIYLKYAKMYAIAINDIEIGLVMISNDNEIGIFIEPNFQNNGIATVALQLLKEKINLKEVVAEVTLDNEQAIKILQKNGFVETNEKRFVTIDGIDVLVKKYINSNFSRY